MGSLEPENYRASTILKTQLCRRFCRAILLCGRHPAKVGNQGGIATSKHAGHAGRNPKNDVGLTQCACDSPMSLVPLHRLQCCWANTSSGKPTVVARGCHSATSAPDKHACCKSGSEHGGGLTARHASPGRGMEMGCSH